MSRSPNRIQKLASVLRYSGLYRNCSDFEGRKADWRAHTVRVTRGPPDITSRISGGLNFPSTRSKHRLLHPSQKGTRSICRRNRNEKDKINLTGASGRQRGGREREAKKENGRGAKRLCYPIRPFLQELE